MVTDLAINVTEVTARSSNGYNFIKGKVFSTENPRFAIQFLHGATEHIGRYTEFAEYMCKKFDCAVIAHDQCGHGLSVFDKSEYGYFAARRGYKHVVNDTHGFLVEAIKTIGNIPVFLMGYDMGSLIARASAEQFEEDFAGLILIGTSYKNFMMQILLKKCQREIAQNSESYLSVDLHKKFLFVSNKKYEDNTGFAWLNSNEEELNDFLNDPICNFSLSASAIKDVIKVRIAVNESKWFKEMPNIPMLLLTGEDDPVGKFGKHSYKIADKLKANQKIDVNVVTYPKARHDLLHENCKEQVFNDIANWINKRVL